MPPLGPIADRMLWLDSIIRIVLSETAILPLVSRIRPRPRGLVAGAPSVAPVIIFSKAGSFPFVANDADNGIAAAVAASKQRVFLAARPSRRKCKSKHCSLPSARRSLAIGVISPLPQLPGLVRDGNVLDN